MDIKNILLHKGSIALAAAVGISGFVLASIEAKDHTRYYCPLNNLNKNHQEEEITNELNNKKYYLYEKEETLAYSESAYNEKKEQGLINGEVKIEEKTVVSVNPAEYKELPDGTKVLDIPANATMLDGTDYYKIERIVRTYMVTTKYHAIVKNGKLGEGWKQLGTYKFKDEDAVIIMQGEDGKFFNCKVSELTENEEKGSTFIGIVNEENYMDIKEPVKSLSYIRK